MPRLVIFSKGGRSVYEIGALDDALSAAGFEVEVRHPARFGVTVGVCPLLTYDGEPFALPDLVLTRTGSGTGSHAALILREMETRGVIVVNSVAAIQAAMDKIYTMQRAAGAGLPIPRTLIHTAEKMTTSDWKGGYPLVVKLATGSHGDGTLKCDTPSQLKALVGLMRALGQKRPFLIQEYLGDRPGRDLRVLVIGGKAVGAMMRSAHDGDFRANISAGGVGENFPLTPEIIRISESIVRLLGLEVAGVDLLFLGDGYALCECNSAPGFRGFETYCGLSVAGTIAGYVTTRLNSPATLNAGTSHQGPRSSVARY